MTSRKLLTLTDGLSEDSWFKMAVRRDLKRLEAEATAAANNAIKDRNKSELYRKVKAG